MQTNKVKQLSNLGQSIWLDFFDRKLMNSGQLQQYIEQDGVSGITSNPSIFEKAIASSTDYDEDIQKLSHNQGEIEQLFFLMAVKDIQRAAEFFEPVYHQSGGTDGFVSLEVSPRLARDTEATNQQAIDLWKKVGKKNVMIKIPGTREGLPAIQQCIREGVNINITLLFGLERYREVTDAYLAGLEERIQAGGSVDGIASVASFFLSRIDVLLDPVLEQKGLKDLKGKVAIALAKKAYQIYKEVFQGERFKQLSAKGVRPQKVLWASTSTKNPDEPDTKYVEALIGPQTINTIPVETLDAYRDHGDPKPRLEEGIDEANETLKKVETAGIQLAAVSDQLENEGLKKFDDAFQKLLTALKEKSQTITQV